ncbi:hypothetical protein [Shewanella sp. SNU WT4]|uniref:hypothetical protein n=1 Tax=Shewanella sp. SNU WT4 TaxID=2590015 RepID=UPI001F10BD84|nr:hypothetical protein [Shewanella sp. SNU WT4]
MSFFVPTFQEQGISMYFDCITSKAKYQIHLSVVLECLAICEQQGHVPIIEKSWWNDTQRRYPGIVISLEDMKHVSQEKPIYCERSDDPIMFIVAAQNDELTLDFVSLLAIVSIAEEHGVISKLHDNWWLILENIYGQPLIRA